MENKVFILKEWSFSLHDDYEDVKAEKLVCAHGNAYNNPNFNNGLYINTSVVKKIVLGENYFDVETRNSLYRCYFCDSAESEFKFLSVAGLFSGVGTETLGEIERKVLLSVEEKKKNDSERLLKAIPEDDECLIMIFADSKQYYFNDFIVKKGTEMVHHDISVHTGMFQDSVLISGKGNKLIDFRYFPYQGNSISFYSWGDYEGKIYAVNAGECDFEMDTPLGSFLLKPNVTAYLIDKASTEGRIPKTIAPSIDLYNVWDVKVDEDGAVSYSAPKGTEE